jgi:PIN domain nuclease of toxin-antitoxin system
VILLDTHALIWWVGGDARLSAPVAKLIKQNLAEHSVLISAISAWEVAQLVARDRLVLSRPVSDWLDLVQAIDGVRFVPIDQRVAVESVNLPGDFHKDPADRFLVATARLLGATLISCDDKIRAYAHVNTFWS